MILGAIALLLLAFALVGAELFVPSHGVLAVVAILVAVGSVVMAYQSAPAMGLLFTVILMIATPLVFYWAVRIYPTTEMGRRVLLRNPASSATAGFKQETARLEELLGRQGVALTLLRPVGSVEIEGKRIEAVSESELIASGAVVEVIRINGRKVIVRAVEQA